MISENAAKNYCEDDISLIENYDIAVNSKEKWDCHHRLETDLNVNRQYLIDNDLYYNRPASELIFFTHGEHTMVHLKGKHQTEEHKMKKAESMKGKQRTEETRKKMSESHKDKQHTDETKRKMSESRKGMPSPNKGKHWKVINGKREYYTN